MVMLDLFDFPYINRIKITNICTVASRPTNRRLSIPSPTPAPTATCVSADEGSVPPSYGGT